MPSNARVRAPQVVLNITQELIENAIPRDSSHCMIAEAIKAAYPTARSVSVDLQTIRFSDPAKGRRYTYLTPRHGQVCLVNWDQGQRPEPFSMKLHNGQVTKAATAREKAERASRAKKTEPIEPDAVPQKGPEAEPAVKAPERKAYERTRLVRSDGVPARIGGRTPPVPTFAKRRAFGIRGLTA